MRGSPDEQIVTRALRGDRKALEELVTSSLPLLYNIIGRALNGHPDTDDVVQDTAIRLLRGLPGLRDPGAYRSWLVAVAVRRVRDHVRARQRSRQRQTPLEEAAGVADPAADFAELTTLRLGLSGQRREVAAATRWLDDEQRELLALWWLEESGELDRADLVDALGLSPRHVAVRVQRMKEQLDTGRAIVRALAQTPACPELAALVAAWDKRPGPLWRKRLGRHVRRCTACSGRGAELIPAERLLYGLALLPVPPALATLPSAAPAGPAVALPARGALHALGHGKLLVAGAVVAAGAATGGVIVLTGDHHDHATPVAARTTQAASPAPTPSRAAGPAKQPPVAVAHPSRAATGICRKGVSTWAFAAAGKSLAESGACWFYTWAPDPLGVRGKHFVPMIWGARSVTASNLAAVRKRGPVLLGFNEPDMAAQSDMTPEQALALWPKLQSTGLRLGSPGVAAGADQKGGWLDRFMTGAAARHYRVDFIALHWYGSDFRTAAAVGQLRSYIQAVYARYHRPIWLTEYALIKFGAQSVYPSGGQQAAFVKSSTAMLESLPYVERYAWFALPATSGSGTGLYSASGAPTAAGRAFQSVRSKPS